jgi:hypothetical protein
MNSTVTELLARCSAANLALSIEGDMLCIDHERPPPADLVEELRRYKPEIMAVLKAPNVISPTTWFAAGVDEPNPERRGLVGYDGGMFLHFCGECGRWGSYGYGCIGANLGRWYCREHRPDR